MGRRQLRRGRGLWRLATIEADAFWDKPHNQGVWWFAPRGFLRASSLVSLVVSERHVSADGSSVAMVGGSGGGGVWFRGGVVLVVVFILDVMVVLLAGLGGLLVLYLAMALLMGRGLPSQWRARKARARLRQLRPDGARVVRSLARDRSSPTGRGAELMRELQLIADDNEWTLVLEAANERLAVLYEGLGWRRLGAEVVPSGQILTAMVRRPGGPIEGGA